MLIHLEHRPASEAPFADLPFGLKIRARAAAERRDGHHTGKVLVYSRPSVVLIAHEVDHILRDSKEHHHWGHLCGRVGHAVRVFGSLHLHPRAVTTAETLLAVKPGVPVEVAP